MPVNTIGRRKTAKARASLKEGEGTVRVNKKPLERFPEMEELRMKEPLRIAGELSDEVDIDVNVDGGGKMGQAEAARMAIARALVEYSDDEDLEEDMRGYDRYMLVEDFRRTETRKPSQSSQGARHKQQKSYR
ncbi:MAG: 30S ribosomal protein S9 [Candidatus Nanohaloarchaeota archaeon QJJ-7]|nr:30S ribosomal protein S9 [Candidatus Nanohaloarchaeota archaeon QJJ-7]